MTTKPKVGDKVGVDHPDYPGTWIVKSTNGPVNAALESESGRRLRAPYTLLTDAPVAGAVPGSTVQAVPTVEYYVPGELVKVNGKYAGLYVVLADKGEKVNLAKLGGDGGRYLRAVKRGLVKVDPAEMLK